MLDKLQHGIIISCQAVPGDPTFGTDFMVAFALAAMRGGAVGIRASGAPDAAAIKKATGLPVIGIWKRPGLDGKMMITPTLDDITALVNAGADMVGLDVSSRPRPNGLDGAALIQQAKKACPDTLLMADCATLEQALYAEAAGADIVAPTLAAGPDAYHPDLPLLEKMAQNCRVPVIAEGGYWDPADVTRAFQLGAYAVVIGSAVTRPWLVTERYVQAIPGDFTINQEYGP